MVKQLRGLLERGKGLYEKVTNTVEPQVGLVPINDTGLYITPETPADVTDCNRWPGSPLCGNGFDFSTPLGYELEIVQDNCNIGIQLTSTLAFIILPPVQIVYRFPQCREEEPPPPDPDPPAGAGFPSFPPYPDDAFVKIFISAKSNTVSIGRYYFYGQEYSYLKTTINGRNTWSNTVCSETRGQTAGRYTPYKFVTTDNNGDVTSYLEDPGYDYADINDAPNSGSKRQIEIEGEIKTIEVFNLFLFVGEFKFVKKAIHEQWEGTKAFGNFEQDTRDNNDPEVQFTSYIKQTLELTYIITEICSDKPPKGRRRFPPPPPPPKRRCCQPCC